MAELLFEIEYFQSSRILSHVTTTKREIRDLFSCLDISKACGPDGISNKIIRFVLMDSRERLLNWLTCRFRWGFFRRDGKLQM